MAAADVTLTQYQASEIIQKQLFSETIAEMLVTPKWFYSYRHFISAFVREMANGAELKVGTDDQFKTLFWAASEVKDNVFFVLRDANGINDAFYVPVENTSRCIILKSKWDEIELLRSRRRYSLSSKQSPSPKTYIMLDKKTNYYKIGKSIYPEFREKTLQSEMPKIKTVLLHDSDIELVLHKKYKEKRVRGEWFKLTADDVLDLISEHGFYKPISSN